MQCVTGISGFSDVPVYFLVRTGNRFYYNFTKQNRHPSFNEHWYLSNVHIILRAICMRRPSTVMWPLCDIMLYIFRNKI